MLSFKERLQAKKNIEPALVAPTEEIKPPKIDTHSIDYSILEEATIAVDDIVPRIKALDALSEIDATKEMKLLKKALVANPAAVSLMMPEDIGTLIRNLRRTTAQALVTASTKKPRKTKTAKVNLSKEAIKDVLDF